MSARESIAQYLHKRICEERGAVPTWHLITPFQREMWCREADIILAMGPPDEESDGYAIARAIGEAVVEGAGGPEAFAKLIPSEVLITEKTRSAIAAVVAVALNLGRPAMTPVQQEALDAYCADLKAAGLLPPHFGSK